jgi:hypothetical protein
VAVSYENANKLSGSIKVGGFFDRLRDRQLIKKYSTARSLYIDPL